jgi:molybdopterin converting factor small subunit
MRKMNVDVEISSIFARYANNQSKLRASGKTVGECLHDLAKQYPELGKLLIDKNGNLVQSFDIFINGESAYPNTMSWPVKKGDKLHIVMLIHGG